MPGSRARSGPRPPRLPPPPSVERGVALPESWLRPHAPQARSNSEPGRAPIPSPPIFSVLPEEAVYTCGRDRLSRTHPVRPRGHWELPGTRLPITERLRLARVTLGLVTVLVAGRGESAPRGPLNRKRIAAVLGRGGPGIGSNCVNGTGPPCRGPGSFTSSQPSG